MHFIADVADSSGKSPMSFPNPKFIVAERLNSENRKFWNVGLDIYSYLFIYLKTLDRTISVKHKEQNRETDIKYERKANNIRPRKKLTFVDDHSESYRKTRKITANTTNIGSLLPSGVSL